MIQSELKRFMLLMAVALFIGAISFSAGIAQEEAKGGAEAAAAEDAEGNQRAGLRVSLTRLSAPEAAEEAPAEEVVDAEEADDGEETTDDLKETFQRRNNKLFEKLVRWSKE